MVPEPRVAEGVVQQVQTIPPWLLPLWANWPLVVLGTVMVILMLIWLIWFGPKIQLGFQRLGNKMEDLGERVSDHRTKTLQELQGLRMDVQHLNHRVVLLEEKDRSSPGGPE